MSEKSPYWSWVKKHGGYEPIESNLDRFVDPASLERPEVTNYGAKFTAWLQTGYGLLTERQKQVFHLAFEAKKSDLIGALRIGISLRRYKEVKARLKLLIAKELGIRL